MYIWYLRKFGASAIILESGKQILVRLTSGDRPATQTVAHATQQALVALSGMAAEVAQDRSR